MEEEIQNPTKGSHLDIIKERKTIKKWSIMLLIGIILFFLNENIRNTGDIRSVIVMWSCIAVISFSLLVLFLTFMIILIYPHIEDEDKSKLRKIE